MGTEERAATSPSCGGDKGNHREAPEAASPGHSALRLDMLLGFSSMLAFTDLSMSVS